MRAAGNPPRPPERHSSKPVFRLQRRAFKCAGSGSVLRVKSSVVFLSGGSLSYDVCLWGPLARRARARPRHPS
jgi:hypothetical protein